MMWHPVKLLKKTREAEPVTDYLATWIRLIVWIFVVVSACDLVAGKNLKGWFVDAARVVAVMRGMEGLMFDVRDWLKRLAAEAPSRRQLRIPF
ncbi:MAG: hypothetical protein HY644_02420 [Acidobacteria bacterium]|nr:hypothetical protein [Acidobacteriota bacterium]